MKAGEMRHRIKILERKPDDSAVVDLAPGFNVVATVWAKKEDKINDQLWGASNFNAERRKQLIIRYRNDITEEMSVELEGRTLRILGIAELGNSRQWLILLVGEVVNVGS